MVILVSFFCHALRPMFYFWPFLKINNCKFLLFSVWMLFLILCFSLFLQILEFLLRFLNDDEMIASSVALLPYIYIGLLFLIPRNLLIFIWFRIPKRQLRFDMPLSIRRSDLIVYLNWAEEGPSTVSRFTNLYTQLVVPKQQIFMWPGLKQ